MKARASSRSIWPWLLWLGLSVTIVAAFYYAPRGKDFIGESSRILFFHVPMAWTSSIAFVSAGIASMRYLFQQEKPRFDHSALASVELGMVFCILASVTGAMWARTEWGVFWNWDPRQITIFIVMVFYAAYFGLRASIGATEKQRRLAAVFGALGLFVAPYLFYVAPRQAAFSLHPQPVINTDAELRIDIRMVIVLVSSSALFTALYFWIHRMRCRVLDLADRRRALALAARRRQ